MDKKKVIIVILSMVVIILVCFGLYKFLVKEDDLENPNFIPNTSGDIIQNIVQSGENAKEKFIIGEREEIFTEEDYPVIDGSTATMPLSEAFKAEFLGKSINELVIQ